MGIDLSKVVPAEAEVTQSEDLGSLESIIENISSFPGWNDASGDVAVPGNGVTKRACFLGQLGLYKMPTLSEFMAALRKEFDGDAIHFIDLRGFTSDREFDLEKKATEIVNAQADRSKQLYFYRDWRVHPTEYRMSFGCRMNKMIEELRNGTSAPTATVTSPTTFRDQIAEMTGDQIRIAYRLNKDGFRAAYDRLLKEEHS